MVNDLITNYLQRTDWPMVDGSGHSIQEKYYSSYTGAARQQRLAQLALNIIDYVRSAESKLTVVQPIRAKWIGTVFTPDFVNSSIQGTDDTFKGLTRAPHITEMGFWVSDTPEPSGTNAGRYRSVALVEIYLPQNYGLTTLDLLHTDGQANTATPQVRTAASRNWSLYVGEMSATTTDSSGKSIPLYYLSSGAAATNEYNVIAPKNPTTSPTFIWDAQSETAAQVASSTSKSKMTPGSYRILAMETWRAKSKTALPTVTLRTAITVTGGPRIDVCPLATPSPINSIPSVQHPRN